MSEVIRSSTEFLQEESDEFISKKFSSDVFNNYQSLVKGSDRISTGIFGSLAEAQIASEVAKPEATVAEAVTQAGGMARRTLSGVLEAGEIAAKVMRFRV
jgi:hypothetical protein